MDFVPLDKCLCCGSAGLSPAIDLGKQAPANAVHDCSIYQRRYPLRVSRCGFCSHFQLDRSLDPQALYRDYPYATGVSARMLHHLKVLSGWIGPAGRVVEIGCNDGSLLKAMRDRSCEVIGIDPATSWNDLHRANELTVLNEMWGDDIADLLPPADVVVGTNVLAHLRDPRAALLACDRVLKPDGMAVFEVHRAASVILSGQFDTIYHEHLSYFTARSAAALAEGTPFVLTDIVPLDIHGGSFRLVYRREGKRATFVDPPALDDPATLADYGPSLLKRRKELLAVLRPGAVCIGASARATVMLQTWKPPVYDAVDDAPLKIGKYVAGRGIPIRSFAWLAEAKPQQVLLGAWNLYETFRPRLAAMLPGTELVSYQPEARVETL